MIETVTHKMTAERRMERKHARCERRRLRKKYKPKYKRCDECGGRMSWCTCCQMWSRTCCEDYGTCMCS
jgi:hypothetical protein